MSDSFQKLAGWGDRLDRVFDYKRHVTSRFQFSADPRILAQTPDWYTARRGRITASKRAATIATGAQRAWQTMLTEIEYELSSKYERDGFTNEAMQWGNDHEDEAMANAELELGAETHEPGFILHPKYPWAGATPDFYIGDDTTGQIKCPYKPDNHTKYIYDPKLDGVYYHQVQWEAWCSKRKKIVFMSYDPRQPLATRSVFIHLDADLDLWDKFERRLEDFRKMVDGESRAEVRFGGFEGIPQLF